MRMMLRQANAALLRAVQRLVGDAAGAPQLVIEAVESEPWASLTFKGERHQIHGRIEGAAAAVTSAVQRIRAGLLEATDVPVPGLFVADAKLSEMACAHHSGNGSALDFCLEVLLIEE